MRSLRLLLTLVVALLLPRPALAACTELALNSIERSECPEAEGAPGLTPDHDGISNQLRRPLAQLCERPHASHTPPLSAAFRMIASSAIGVPPSRCSFSKNITGASPVTCTRNCPC